MASVNNETPPPIAPVPASSTAFQVTKDKHETLAQLDSLQHLTEEIQFLSRSVICDGCKIYFGGQSSLDKHNVDAFKKATAVKSAPYQVSVIVKHNSNSQQSGTPGKQQNGKIWCSYCEKAFAVESLFRKHLQVCLFRLEILGQVSGGVIQMDFTNPAPISPENATADKTYRARSYRDMNIAQERN